MSNIWERFESIATPDEVVEAKTQFAPIETGSYKMTLEEIAPAESKDGLPMVKGKFRIADSNRVVFYNQNLQNLNYPNMTAVNIAEAVTFISGIVNEEVEFTGLSAFADLISGIQVGGMYNVEVNYGKNDYDKKFPKLKILGIVDEDFMNIPDGIEEELPFK